jgi:hypothetical protein
MENKEQALVKETGEVFTIENKRLMMSIELTLPDGFDKIAQSMIDPSATNINCNNKVSVEMFYNDKGLLDHRISHSKLTLNEDSNNDNATFVLSNGVTYSGNELIVGLDNIRDYKLRQLH